ncbi:hypothetical protein LTR35_006199 [Friedmanniomyces endolithicus]|uniref:NAD(P)-binding domain-containing protein n=1 Tax=Friedmanniomyces endolithicus TaxID=329885 RepID=A0AAN6FTW5_9PEZI|nr:hypothetical protein LTR35_006199 [Friedmanniomyces endolithicus]KAK0301325.1 hypothetical protein LTS00_000474 [Friedmanniomyces endolithicus]KAK0322241.1 hypothetical protein LTR82_006694 [Friedmanniomyces endolithicus]KAK1014489.1 hypothetical protein LTR54_004141 [Friedmanniomyces endolithicus]
MPQIVWLITGCSSGFGEQFVHSILARGDKVIGTARNLDKLLRLVDAGVQVLQLDITNGQTSINATFDTNVFGTIKVTRALLPHFRERRAGVNVFIGSLSGWIGHDFCGTYAGSKFALEGIMEALRLETEPLGIRTLLIEPGRFRTRLLSGDSRKTKTSAIPDYYDLSSSKSDGLDAENMRQPGDPSKLVEIVLDLVRHEGVAKYMTVPLRMPLGIDCYDDIKAKCEETLRLLEDWRGVITSTDMSDGDQ